MSFRTTSLVALGVLALSSTAAFAGLVTVASYDMNNGNGATQFTTPTGAQNYFDWTYTKSGQSSPTGNASQNGSNQQVPNNAAPKDALLTGGTGMLTDGMIATQVYSLVSSATSTISNKTYFGQPTEYVGWKYQDPNITFHLAAGQNVGSIELYVAANNPAIGNANGLVAAPGKVELTINGQSVAVNIATSAINAFTSMITLSGFGSIASASVFSLTLDRGPLQQDGINYYNDHVKEYNPADPYNVSNCVDFCDPNSGPYSSGFRTEAALGQTGALAPNSGLEPWIMLSEVQFLTAVPEPSTWVMMILGFAAMGFGTYRKRQAAMAAA